MHINLIANFKEGSTIRTIGSYNIRPYQPAGNNMISTLNKEISYLYIKGYWYMVKSVKNN